MAQDDIQPEIMRLLRRPELLRIVATTVVGVLAAVIYVLVAPNWYRSTLSVVPAGPSKGPSPFAGALSSLGGAADLASLDLGMNADVERIAAVLKSTSVTDAVIERFDLLQRYDERYIEFARRALWKHCSVAIERKAKVVSLTCEDKEPPFVQMLLNFFGERGNETFRRVSAATASEEVHFLEQRVAEMKAATDEAAQTLRVFEEQHKIIDLEAQSKAVVSSIASLRSQVISKELELSYLGSFSSSEEVTAQQLRQQLTVLRAKARLLEQAPATGNDGAALKVPGAATQPDQNNADIFPPALSVPQLRFELEQLYRVRKLAEANLVLLMQRLETAKVNQARDTSTFAILDAPTLPTYRSWPRRMLVLAMGLGLGFLVGVAWIFGPAYVRSLMAFYSALPVKSRES